MRRFLPILQWLPAYKSADFPKDLLAGITVGIVIIPQGMAYAMLAGLSAQFGLYAALVPLLCYLFLGTSPQLALGPVALDSLLVALGLGALGLKSPEDYIAAAILLAFIVGGIQFFLGLFRMGFLVNFLSKPLISGFTSAAALIIIFSQFEHLLGISMDTGTEFYEIAPSILSQLPSLNIFDFALGVSSIFLLVLFKKLNRKIPGILIVVIIGILVVYQFELESRGVGVVGPIPAGLPGFQSPSFNWALVREFWPFALTLALVGYLEAVSIAKGIGDKSGKGEIDANQELLALGTSNLFGSFFQSYPVTASFSRSAIGAEAGGRTNLAALFTVSMVVVSLLFLTPVFYYLPKAILAGIITVSVFNLIDPGYARELWYKNRDEFVVLLLTFLVTLGFGVPQGILIGVLCSLLLMVYRTSKPHFAVLGNIKGSDYYKNISRFDDRVEVRPDLLIVRFDSQLYFGNTNYFKKTLQKFILQKGPELKGIVLNAEAINYIDATASHALIKLIREIHNKGIRFFVAGAIGPTRDIIFGSGIIDELGRECLFVETKEAVKYFDHPESISSIGSDLARQRREVRK